jgi:hypothetical protein
MRTPELAGEIVRAVVDAVTAIVLCDLLAGRFGTDWMGGADA